MRPERKDEILFTEKYRYVLGPFIARAANGDWLVTFNMSVRREVGPYSSRRFLHPPYDPEYRNYMIRSRDAGKTWELPRVVPGYEWSGTEHVALCVLQNGDILASFYQRKYLPLEEAEKNQSHRYCWRHMEPFVWVATHNGTFVHRSRDHGETWEETVQIDHSPFITAYSPRNIVQLDEDMLIFTSGAADSMATVPPEARSSRTKKNAQVRTYKNVGGNRLVDGQIIREPARAFICISRDGGHTWKETRQIAAHSKYNFGEPAMIRLASGRLVCHMRNGGQTKHLWQVVSDDGGESWSEPEMTPMWGYPAHLVQLSDDRVLSVYGHRREPYGIRACVSRDDGRTWDYDDEIIIRDDLVKEMIGYPVSMVLEDDTLVTVYWDEDADGETSIVASTYRV